MSVVAVTAALVALTTGLSSFAAGAAPVPDGVATAGPDPRYGARAAVFAALAEGRSTPDDVLELVSALLTSPVDEGGSGLTPVGAAADDVSVVPVAVADLDADGLDDVLTVREEAFTPGPVEPLPGLLATQPTLLEARRGSDGHVVWSRPPPTVGFLTADVTSDAGLEVVLFDALIVSTGGGLGLPTATVLRQTVTVVDGRSGATLWSDTIDGVFLMSPTGMGAIVIGWKDLVLQISPTTDGDGDGDGEVVIGTSDAAVASSLLGAVVDGGRSEFHAKVRNGRDGSQLAHHTSTAVTAAVCSIGVGCLGSESFAYHTVPWIQPGGDVSGDGRDDLLALSFEVTSGTVRAYSVTGGEDHWMVTVPPRAADLVSLEVTGDGTPDVVMTAGWDRRCLRTIRVLDGRTGAPLWADDPASFACWLPVADADGGAGNDLVRIEGDVADQTLTVSDGATGAQQWTRTISASDDEFLSTCLCRADVNGDGADDLFVFRVVLGVSTATIAVSGRDGSTLWELPGPVPTAVFVPVGGDVDGDGAHDLYSSKPVEEGVELPILSGRDGAPLWSALVPASDPEATSVVAAAFDLAGPSGLELLALGNDTAARTFVFSPTGTLWSAP